MEDRTWPYVACLALFVAAWILAQHWLLDLGPGQ